MTDVQLREAVFKVNHDLVDDNVGPWLMHSLNDGQPVNDPRLPRPMPTSPRMHALLGFASAHDSANLAAIGLQLHASAAALAPLRNVAETFVRLSWMLDTNDDQIRKGRAYALTQASLDEEHKMVAAHQRSAQRMHRTVEDWVPKLAAAEALSREALSEMARQDRVTIEVPPPPADMFGQYLGDEGGYTFFSLLSATGVHASALRPFLFYGVGGGGRMIDFDFQGMHGARAYWMSIAVRLHINLALLVAPELSWPNSELALGKLLDRITPLTGEAEKRYMAPLKDLID
jgi:hypothetical protein